MTDEIKLTEEEIMFVQRWGKLPISGDRVKVYHDIVQSDPLMKERTTNGEICEYDRTWHEEHQRVVIFMDPKEGEDEELYTCPLDCLCWDIEAQCWEIDGWQH